MELKIFKTLWGFEGSIEQACQQAVTACFQGIEGPAPASKAEAGRWKECLQRHGLEYIAEITTAGSYVPDRMATVEQHLQSFSEKLEQSSELDPLFVTCLGGCDAWPARDSIRFFETAMRLADESGIEVSFETHRGRSFFNPWITSQVCESIGDLQLTCDFSHWCVVCERLPDIEAENMGLFFQRANHIHARVGFDQGAQVQDPASCLYWRELAEHETWWKQIWFLHWQQGRDFTTMTPEFGPDGYQAINLESGRMTRDLWQLNQWMAARQKESFFNFMEELAELKAENRREPDTGEKNEQTANLQ